PSSQSPTRSSSIPLWQQATIWILTFIETGALWQGSDTLMKSRLTFWLTLLSALSTLVPAGCGGSAGSNTQQQPPPTYQLTVTVPAMGAGTVTSSPAGINC